MRTLIEDEYLILEHGKWKLTQDLSQFEFPTTVEGTITRRLKLLSKEALAIAQISSVMGKELDLSIIREISKIDQDVFFECIDELIERQFIIKEEKTYLLSHDRVRETLYSQLDEKDRQQFHESAGIVLEKKYEEDIESHSNLLAYHFKNGLDKQKAVRYSLMYGDQLRANSMYTVAIDVYEMAVNILEQIDFTNKDKVLFITRKKILFMLSHGIKPETCIECVNKVYGVLYERGGGIKVIKKAVKVMKLMMGMTDKMPNVIKFWVFNKFNIDYDPLAIPMKFDYMHIVTNLVELGFFNAAALFFLGRNKECLDILQDLEDNWLPITHNGIGYACLLAARGNPFCGIAALDPGVTEAEEACETFQKYSPLSFMQNYLECSANFWINNHLVQGGEKNIEKYRTKTYELAEKHSFMDWVGWQALTDFMVPAIAGQPKETGAEFNRLMDISKKMGRPYGLESWINIWHANYHLERGEFDKAKYEVSVIKKLEKQEFGTQRAWSLLLESRILFEQGKLDEAESLLEKFIGRVEEDDLSVLPDCNIALAEIYLKKEKFEDARKLLTKACERATSEKYRHPRYQTMALRVLGLLEIKEKNYEQAKKDLEQSLSVSETIGNFVHQGLASLALADLYIELTQFMLAHKSIERAEEKFKFIDNRYLLKKAESLRHHLKDNI